LENHRVNNKRTIVGLLALAALAPSCLGGGSAPSKRVPMPVPQWQTQQRVPTTSDLRAVSFADYNIGMIAGKDGTIMRTDDGGHRWTQLDFTPVTPLGDIAALAGLNTKVVAVGADAGGGKAWASNNSLSFTMAPAVGSGSPYTDVTLGATGVGPDFPVEIYRLRQNGTIDWTDLSGTDTTILPPVTISWASANSLVYIQSPTSITGAFIVGDNAGAAQIVLFSGTQNKCTIPVNMLTFRSVAASPNRRPFACGDNTAGKGVVVAVKDRTNPLIWDEILGNPGNLPSLRAINFPHDDYGYVVGNGGTIYQLHFDGANWQWTDLNPLGVTNKNLYGVFFADANTGWAVGDEGTVIRITNATTVAPAVTKLSGGDAGINWNALSFSDDGKRGIAVGNGAGNAAKIYRYLTDKKGVSTWTAMALPAGLTIETLNGVSVPRTNAAGTVAYICGANGKLYQNTDVWGVGAWTNPGFTGISGADTYRAVLFTEPGVKGVLAGDNGGNPVLLYTNDGLTWNPATGHTPASTQYSALSSNPAGTTVYASGNGRVNVSTDQLGGWATWGDVTTTGLPGSALTVLQTPETGTVTAMVAAADGKVYALSGGTWAATASPWGAEIPIGLGYQGLFGADQNGMVATNSGKIFTTINGGISWTQSYPHTKALARTIWMSPTDQGLGYAGCDDGVILRTESSGQ
jgi:photosystem II stability/assembly factor-like uncharacterized protein